MTQHQIRLAFNSRVTNYEEKIARIARIIADKFGDKVDISLALSIEPNDPKVVKEPNVPKVIQFKKGISFDDASKLAEEIKEFLKSQEAKIELDVLEIALSDLHILRHYIIGNPPRYARIFTLVDTFEKK